MRSIILLGASALAIAAPAFAQAPNTQATVSTATDEADNAPEIIITASKRARTLQDTPISVAVTTAESIERSQVRDLFDLQTLVPSLRVSQLQSSSNTNFIIRGFGNGANNAGIEPSVGVFIDGVYRSRSAAQIADLPNIERVEVLRGPQSTLFGKNASAGIISIVTAPPSQEFGGNIEASYGNYNATVLKGIVTGGLTDTVAVSLAGNFNRRDGYARYVNLGLDSNNRNRYGGRAQLLWTPSADLRVRLIGDYDVIDERCCTVANVFDGPTGGAIRALGGRVNSNQPFSYDTFANFPATNKFDNYGVSGQVDYALGEQLNLTSITAYREVRGNTNQDTDFTSADLIGNNPTRTAINTFTQELRLASDFDGPLDFLLGGYFFKEKINVDSSLTFGRDFRGYANLLSGNAYGNLEPTLRALVPGIPPGQFGAQGQGRFERYDFRDEAWSVFGEVNVRPVDGLTLTGGFNYTQDRKRVATNNVTTDVFSTVDLVQAGANAGIPGAARTISCAPGAPAGTCNPFLGLRGLQFIPPFLNFPNSVEDGRTADNKFTYTLRARYEFSRNLNAYVTYATGFKASSFNLSIDSRPFARDFIPGSPFAVPAPAASAIRTAGLAVPNLTSGSRFAEPENSEVYEVGLKGSWPGFGFNLAVFQQNIKGFQSNVFVGTGFVLGNAPKESVKGFELDMSFSPVRNLSVTASTTYLDIKYDSFPGGTSFNPATNNTGPADLTGLRPSGIPEWTVAVGGTYTLPLTETMNLTFHTDYQFDSAYFVAQGLAFRASPESLNASISLALNERVEVTAWGRNLTSPNFITTIFPSVAQSGSLSGYPSQPAFYGGSVRFRF